jgi:hypothetical protein
LRNPKGLTVIPEERDAWAFLDAAAITSSRQQRAVIDLVRGLKHAQLWSKMKAIYPFVGGTATTHKYNLKDPRDADAAFRLTFSGGWTHSSTGAKPNGANGWANTYWIPKNQVVLGSASYGIYNRENTSNGINDMAAGLATFPAAHMGLATRYFNVLYADCWSNNNGRISTTNLDSSGFYCISRTAVNSLKAFRNNVQLGTNTNTQTQADFDGVSVSMAIACFNSTGTPNQLNFNNRECAFAFMGDGLTDTDATNLYNIVQRYQTSLGRQV